MSAGLYGNVFKSCDISTKSQGPIKNLLRVGSFVLAIYLFNSVSERFGLLLVGAQAFEMVGLWFVAQEALKRVGGDAGHITSSITSVFLITFARVMRLSTFIQFDIDGVGVALPKEMRSSMLLLACEFVGLAMGMFILSVSQKDMDLRLLGGLLVGCVLLAFTVYPAWQIYSEAYDSQRWMLAHVVECIAMIPQIMSMRTGGTVASNAAHFCACMVVSAVLGLMYGCRIVGCLDGDTSRPELHHMIHHTFTKSQIVGLTYLVFAVGRVLAQADFGVMYMKAVFERKFMCLDI